MTRWKIPTLAALSVACMASFASAQDAMFAQLPETALGPDIDQEIGYGIEELGRGLYHSQ